MRNLQIILIALIASTKISYCHMQEVSSSINVSAGIKQAIGGRTSNSHRTGKAAGKRAEKSVVTSSNDNDEGADDLYNEANLNKALKLFRITKQANLSIVNRIYGNKRAALIKANKDKNQPQLDKLEKAYKILVNYFEKHSHR